MQINTKENNSLNKNIYKRIFNVIIFGTFGTLLAQSLWLIFNIIIARILNETDYGAFSIIENTFSTFTIFTTIATNIVILRGVSLYKRKNKKLLGIIIKTLILINLIITIFILILLFIFSKPISDLISKDYNISLYLRIGTLIIFFATLFTTLQCIFQGLEKFKNIVFFKIIAYIVLIISAIILTLKFKLLGSVLSLLILNIFLSILYLIAIKKFLKREKIQLKFKFNNTIKKIIKNASIPAILFTIVAYPFLWILNFIFIKTNGYEEFAAFSVCLQWFSTLYFVSELLGQVEPIYIQLYEENNIDELKKIFKMMVWISFLFAFIPSMILISFSPILLKLYGDFYTAYKIPFIIMLLTAIVFSIEIQFEIMFYSMGKIWYTFFLNLIWAIVLIICYFCLQHLGVLGYTLSYLISYIVYTLLSIITFKITFKKNIIKYKKI